MFLLLYLLKVEKTVKVLMNWLLGGLKRACLVINLLKPLYLLCIEINCEDACFKKIKNKFFCLFKNNLSKWMHFSPLSFIFVCAFVDPRKTQFVCFFISFLLRYYSNLVHKLYMLINQVRDELRNETLQLASKSLFALLSR